MGVGMPRHHNLASKYKVVKAPGGQPRDASWIAAGPGNEPETILPEPPDCYRSTDPVRRSPYGWISISAWDQVGVALKAF